MELHDYAISAPHYALRSHSLHDTPCSLEFIITSTTTLPPSLMDQSHNIHLSLHTSPPPSLYLRHNYQDSLLLILPPIDPIHTSSFPLSIHPSICPFIYLSSHPFISIGMWEVEWTHLMGLYVSRKWLAQVSHWLYRRATRCCPRLPWCQTKCLVSWEELERNKERKIKG